MILTDIFYDPTATLADEVYAAEFLADLDDTQPDLLQS